MFGTNRLLLVICALSMIGITAAAQKDQQKQTVSVDGRSGDVAVIHLHGRTFVDVEDLARIAGGTVASEPDRIVLTLPQDSAEDTDESSRSAFSRDFRRAAIEAMASMREWAGMVMITVQNGYPVGNNMAGNTIMALQGRAAERVSMASVAASTDSDKRGLELLRNEFDNAQAWSDRFIQARSSLGAANMTMTEGAFNDDEDAQKIIRCGRFLAQMFAGEKFQDDVSCH